MKLTKRFAALLAVLLLASAMTACASAVPAAEANAAPTEAATAGPAGVRVTDMMGREVACPNPRPA